MYNNVGICYLTNLRQNAETVISTTPGIAHSCAIVKVGCCLLEDFSFSSSLLWPGSLQQVKTKIALENELYKKQPKK